MSEDDLLHLIIHSSKTLTMKNILLIALVAFSMSANAQYFRYHFNSGAPAGSVPRPELFHDGLASKFNYQSGITNRFYNVGWGEDIVLATTDTSDRVRFVKQKFNGGVIQNTAIEYCDFTGLMTQCYNQHGTSIAELNNGSGTGGFMGVGEISSNSFTGALIAGNSDQLITKINNSGVPTSSYKIDVAGGSDRLSWISRSNFPANTFIACGTSFYTNTTGALSTGIVVERINTIPNISWLRNVRILVGGAAVTAIANSLIEDPTTGMIYVVGDVFGNTATPQSGFVLVLNSAGTVQNIYQYNNPLFGNISFNAVALANNGDLVVCGSMDANNPLGLSQASMLVRISPTGFGVVFSNIYAAIPSWSTPVSNQALDLFTRLNTGSVEEFYFVGPSQATNGWSPTIWKTDGNGNPVFHKQYVADVLDQLNSFAVDQLPNSYTYGGISLFANIKPTAASLFGESYSLRTYFNLATCTNDCGTATFPFASVTLNTASPTYTVSSNYTRIKLRAYSVNCLNFPICNQSGTSCGSNYKETADLILTNTNLDLYPNPAAENISIVWNATEGDDATIQVIDLLGKVCIEMPIEINEGLNEENLDVNDLVSGTYLLRVSGSKTNLQKMFIKE